MRKWAKGNGYKIIAIEQDAISGTMGLSDRPGLRNSSAVPNPRRCADPFGGTRRSPHPKIHYSSSSDDFPNHIRRPLA